MNSSARILGIIGLFLGCSSGAQTSDANAAGERLPPGVIPAHYELKLHPDGDKLMFTGQVTVDLRVVTPVAQFVLNSKGLVLDSVSLDGGSRAQVTLDDKLEQATLRFPRAVAAGAHKLMIEYHGPITRGTLGFFAMDYDAAAGGKRRTLATNFEPASERTLMPSWDEPAFKATFGLTVDAPADRMAISNMPVESESPLPNGMKRVRFARTPKMSTYLLFLGIGDYERISESVDGIKVGVVVAKGGADRGRYALREAVRLMHYYNGYFGVRYPLPKLDLVAAPGEIQGGSMENWGAIFYSQQHILFDTKDSTEADRQTVFLVVAHEMAHQWFGDLVTMQWWDNLWLNEGFARWMQTKAADDLNPEWQTGLQATNIIEQGMRADAKSSTHAVEKPVATVAEAMLSFDEITYDKGAAVIGMLENYVGAVRFRDGVRSYMHAHTFGNTHSSDLWRALQNAAGKPVDGIAEDFTRRAGLPLVTVDADNPGQAGHATLTQSRFFEAHDPDSNEPQKVSWRLPLAYRSIAGEQGQTLLSGEVGTIVLAGAGPLIVNAGHQSYTRVRYAPAQFDALRENFGSLAAPDQIGMLFDAWALGQSQYAPMTNLLALVDELPLSADPLVWRRAVQILKSIDRLYAELPGRTLFRAWALERLAPLGEKVGWDAAPGESSAHSLLRQPLLETLGRFGDARVIAEARKRDAAAEANPSAQPPAVRRIARDIVARTADAATFERLLAQLRATRDPLDKLNQLDALTDVADPKFAERVLSASISSDVPGGSAPGIFGEIAADHPDLTWRFVLAHIDAPDFPVDSDERMVIVPYILSSSADLRRAGDLQAYAKDHLPPAAAREVESAVSQIELNARVRTTQLPKIDAWLSGKRHAASN